MNILRIVTLATLAVVLVLASVSPALALGKDLGGDGRDDAAIMYDHGGGVLSFYVFDSSGNGADASLAPRRLWRSGGRWYSASCQPLIADVTNDGTADIVTAYDYGGGTTGMWVLPGSGTGSSPSRWWVASRWAAASLKLVASKPFSGSGAVTPIGYYDYGNGRMGLWVFDPSGSSTFVPKRVYQSANGFMWGGNVKAAGGDFNGDGKGDAAVLYDYGGATSGIWLFLSNGSTFTRHLVWKSARGKFDWKRSRVTAGDYNGDGQDEVGVQYNKGSSDALTNFWTFTLNGSSMQPKLVTQSFDIWLGMRNERIASGDFTADGKDDVVAFVHYSTPPAVLDVFPGPSMPYNYNEEPAWWGSWSFDRSRLVP